MSNNYYYLYDFLSNFLSSLNFQIKIYHQIDWKELGNEIFLLNVEKSLKTLSSNRQSYDSICKREIYKLDQKTIENVKSLLHLLAKIQGSEELLNEIKVR